MGLQIFWRWKGKIYWNLLLCVGFSWITSEEATLCIFLNFLTVLVSFFKQETKYWFLSTCRDWIYVGDLCWQQYFIKLEIKWPYVIFKNVTHILVDFKFISRKNATWKFIVKLTVSFIFHRSISCLILKEVFLSILS